MAAAMGPARDIARAMDTAGDLALVDVAAPEMATTLTMAAVMAVAMAGLMVMVQEQLVGMDGTRAMVWAKDLVMHQTLEDGNDQ